MLWVYHGLPWFTIGNSKTQPLTPWLNIYQQVGINRIATNKDSARPCRFGFLGILVLLPMVCNPNLYPIRLRGGHTYTAGPVNWKLYIVSPIVTTIIFLPAQKDIPAEKAAEHRKERENWSKDLQGKSVFSHQNSWNQNQEPWVNLLEAHWPSAWGPLAHGLVGECWWSVINVTLKSIRVWSISTRIQVLSYSVSLHINL